METGGGQYPVACFVLKEKKAMRYIDIRSDTVTQPTQRMRDEMYKAVVGDDVQRDDPTMNKLEKLAARMVGKEAAMFTPSGTMGNQVSIMTHTRRGDEVICGEMSHIVIHEVGAPAVLSGVMVRTIKTGDYLRPEQLAPAIRPDDIHMPHTGLVEVENPTATGLVVPLEVMRQNYELAHQAGLPVHLDGARLFNAATALGCDVKEITQYCDSVMFCLSKGLCAPVGSIVAGSREFIDRARKNRKLLGGGLRQAGFLAAAGIVALEEMTGRLQEDHDNARYMAVELNKLDGIQVDMESVQISMVFFTIDRDAAFIEALPAKMLEKGIKISGIEDGMFRFVTNHDVSREDVDYVLACMKDLLAQ